MWYENPDGSHNWVESIIDHEEFSQRYRQRTRSKQFGTVAVWQEGDSLYTVSRGGFHAYLMPEGAPAVRLSGDAGEADEVEITNQRTPSGKSRVILGSKGLWEFIGKRKMREIIEGIDDPREASRHLLEEASRLARERGGAMPNMTAIVKNIDHPELPLSSTGTNELQEPSSPAESDFDLMQQNAVKLLPQLDSNREHQISEISIGGHSEASILHPERNEDNYFRIEKKNAAGVLDGVGGSERGEVASTKAREYIMIKINDLPDNISPEEMQKALERILKDADVEIQRTVNNGATTATIMKIINHKGKRIAVFASIGDSRAYLRRADGSFETITNDDGIAGSATQRRLSKATKASELSKKDYIIFLNRNKISAALGYDQGNPHSYIREIVKDDLILLTTDGVHDNLTDTQIDMILNQEKEHNANEIARKLIMESQSVASKWHSRPTETEIINIMDSDRSFEERIDILVEHAKINYGRNFHYLSKDQIRAIWENHPSNQAQKLKEAARDICEQIHLRSKPDDMTAVVIKVGENRNQALPEPDEPNGQSVVNLPLPHDGAQEPMGGNVAGEAGGVRPTVLTSETEEPDELESTITSSEPVQKKLFHGLFGRNRGSNKEQENTESSIVMGGETIAGDENEHPNQDYIWFNKELGGAVVCDGVSGTDGEKASRTIVGEIRKAFEKAPRNKNLKQATKWIKQIVLEANKQLAYKKYQGEISANAQTTICLAYFWESPKGEKRLISVNVGDSRLSRLRDNYLTDITLDQAPHQYPVKKDASGDPILVKNKYGQDVPVFEIDRPFPESEVRRIQRELNEIEDPNKLQGSLALWYHNRNIIYGSVDGENSLEDSLDISIDDIQSGDIYLLRSDGLTDVLTNKQTALTLAEISNDPQRASEALNHAAKVADSSPRSKGYPDDKSTIVIYV